MVRLVPSKKQAGTEVPAGKEENKMRHVYIRGILALVWLVAAVVSGMSGNLEMVVLYVLMGGVFAYTAAQGWRQAKSGRQEKPNRQEESGKQERPKR